MQKLLFILKSKDFVAYGIKFQVEIESDSVWKLWKTINASCAVELCMKNMT